MVYRILFYSQTKTGIIRERSLFSDRLALQNWPMAKSQQLRPDAQESLWTSPDINKRSGRGYEHVVEIFHAR